MSQVAEVVRIRFLSNGKTSTFLSPPAPLKVGTPVVVEMPENRGTFLAAVSTRPYPLIMGNLPAGEEVKPILRIAGSDDFARFQKQLDQERIAARTFREKAEYYCLAMKLISIEAPLEDSRRLTFYFTAEERLDFREMLKDLAAELKARVELLQIGSREETKIIGGIGTCGRTLCCSTFLQSFAPITVKMAKDQDLSLATSKTTGACGKLKCCVSYEHPEYVEAKKVIPPVGATITTKQKTCGKVCGAKVLDRKVLYQVDEGSILEVDASDIIKVELPQRRQSGQPRRDEPLAKTQKPAEDRTIDPDRPKPQIIPRAQITPKTESSD